MITIWHNPRCSKSRQTLALIEGKGAITVRKYLEDAPTAEDIRAALDLLGLNPIDMMRPKEAAFKDMGLTKTDDDETLIAAMAQEPKLIERPIVLPMAKPPLAARPRLCLTCSRR